MEYVFQDFKKSCTIENAIIFKDVSANYFRIIICKTVLTLKKKKKNCKKIIENYYNLKYLGDCNSQNGAWDLNVDLK